MREVSLRRTEFAELSTAILHRGGVLRFRAHGSSMSPFIQDGDVLTIQPAEAPCLNVGDIVFYHGAGDRLVAHRMVGRRVQGGQVVLAMRGDAALRSDEWIQAKQVLGRVVSLQRGRMVIRLDGGSGRLTALLWARLSPFSPLLFRRTGMVKQVALWFIRRLQALTLYRVLARKLIGPKVHYRIAIPEDASDLSRLYRYERPPELGDPIGTFVRQLDRLEGYGCTLIATLGGRTAGAAVIRRYPQNASLYPDWWLFGMLVRTRYRGTGVGEGLVRMALEKAAGEGAARVNVLVFEQNKVAINLYRKMGFRPACIPGLNGQLEEEVGRGERRRIIMSRPVECSLVTTDVPSEDD